MSEKVMCGGYIYKWVTKVGCTEYTRKINTRRSDIYGRLLPLHAS